MSRAYVTATGHGVTRYRTAAGGWSKDRRDGQLWPKGDARGIAANLNMKNRDRADGCRYGVAKV